MRLRSTVCANWSLRCGLALAWLTLMCQEVSADGYAPETDQPHPDFVLPNIETRAPVALSQFRGKKVILIHFASW